MIVQTHAPREREANRPTRYKRIGAVCLEHVLRAPIS